MMAGGRTSNPSHRREGDWVDAVSTKTVDDWRRLAHPQKYPTLLWGGRLGVGGFPASYPT